MSKSRLNYIQVFIIVFAVLFLTYNVGVFTSGYSFIEMMSTHEVENRYGELTSPIFKPFMELGKTIENNISEDGKYNFDGVPAHVNANNQANFVVDAMFVHFNDKVTYYEKSNEGLLEELSYKRYSENLEGRLQRDFMYCYNSTVKAISYDLSEPYFLTVFFDDKLRDIPIKYGVDIKVDTIQDYIDETIIEDEIFVIFNNANGMITSDDQLVSPIVNPNSENPTIVNIDQETYYRYVESKPNGVKFHYYVREYYVKSKYILFIFAFGLVASSLIAFSIYSFLNSFYSRSKPLNIAFNALEQLSLGHYKQDFNFPIIENDLLRKLFNAIEDIRFQLFTMKMLSKTSAELIDLQEFLEVNQSYDQYFTDVHDYLSGLYDFDFAIQLMGGVNNTSLSDEFLYVRYQEYIEKSKAIKKVNDFQTWKEFAINNTQQLSKVIADEALIEKTGVKQLFVLPIYENKRLNGVYIMGSYLSTTKYTKVELRFFRTLLKIMIQKYSWNKQHEKIINENVSLKKTNERLRLQIQRVQSDSITDSVTGLYRKHHIIDALTETVKGSKADEQVAIGIIDIDNYNGVIDRYGHYASENMLKKFGGIVANQLSSQDFAGRYAADVVIVIMHTSNIQLTLQSFDRIRSTVSETSFDNIDQAVTVSIGLTLMQEEDTKHSIIRRAEDLLDDAKHLGKNRICHDFES